MRWRLAPGRFIKSGRSWIPRSKFRPLADVRDAFRLLEAVAAEYNLATTGAGIFSAKVLVAGRMGAADGEPKARTICVALARSLGIDPEVAESPANAETRRTVGEPLGITNAVARAVGIEVEA
jgi:hypothetical protein